MFLNAERSTQLKKSILELYVTNKNGRPDIKTLTFLERTNTLIEYSKIAEFNSLKTSLSLKMPDAYTSNDRIILSMPHYYSIYRQKILPTFDLKF